MSEQDHLALWRAVERTDPAATKQFNRGGGFKGTAISPMWLIRQATQQWGPMGAKWGIRIVAEKLMAGAPLLNEQGAVVGHESVHVVQAEVYHPGGAIPCFGQTTFVGKNKYGIFTDEEAPKKSLTDALTKGLSWLGFAADVHTGLYDDVKYVNRLKEDFAAEAEFEATRDLREKCVKVLAGCSEQGSKAFEECWKKSLTNEQRDACLLDKDRLSALRKRSQEVDRLKAANHQEAVA